MLHFPTWKVVTVFVVLFVGTVLAIPSLLPRATLDALPGWVPKQTVNLGLDLQGGVHLLLEVQTDVLIQERLDGVLDEARIKLRTAKIGYQNLAKSSDTVTVTLLDASAVEQAEKELRAVITEDMEL